MHGYIWEWCADGWRPDYKGAPGDGSAPRDLKSAERVLRGGAWTEVPDHCRSAYRHHAPAETRSDAIGFRCVKKGSGHEK
jgi:formylglycine-generating enzyme required for sulfatase activity